MSTENNYEELLEKVCEKINNLDSIKELDVIDIKNSITSIESLMNESQVKINFDDIKDKLENIAFQVDSCNETLLKDLYNDINNLKDSTNSVAQHIENLQNVQNLALTSAEFEEYQKQQLDLALKTNESIYNELTAIKQGSQNLDGSESIKNLEIQLGNLHATLTGYLEEISKSIENTPDLQEIGAVVSDLNSVQLKSIKQTNVLIKELQAKFNNFESDFKYKEIEGQLAKIGEIYDSLTIINAWIEKVGNINKSIENVYARLGENIDFDDVAEKIDIIYKNIEEVNSLTQKINNIDTSMTNTQTKLAALSTCVENTKNINRVITVLKSKIDTTFSDDIDFEDLSNKMDIVYENITAINEWANKVDIINENVENINTAFEEELIASKVDIIYENMGLLNEWVHKIDDIAQRSEELDNKYTQTNDNINNKIDEISETLSKASNIIENVPNIKDKLDNLSEELNTLAHSSKNDTESYIYTLLDIEADFLKLHKFVEDKTQVTSADINALKDKFSELNDDISSISIRTNKLILSADDANKEFKTYLDMFKQIIAELNVQKQQYNPELKIAILEEKTEEIYKLMQSGFAASKNLNSAFLYFAEWIDATGNIINNMSEDINALSEKFDKHDNTDTNKFIAELKEQITQTNEATEKIADLIETYKNENNIQINTNTDKIIYQLTNIENSFEQNNLEIKTCLNENLSGINGKLSNISDMFETLKNTDISELKSSITGVMVQLNNVQIPDINIINEKIDKFEEEQTNKLASLEATVKETIIEQSGKISALEEKLDMLGNKFDKFMEFVCNDNKLSEIKETLNYVANQSAIVTQAITEQQNSNDVITKVADKLESFDKNINKIVSYIEED